MDFPTCSHMKSFLSIHLVCIFSRFLLLHALNPPGSNKLSLSDQCNYTLHFTNATANRIMQVALLVVTSSCISATSATSSSHI